MVWQHQPRPTKKQLRRTLRPRGRRIGVQQCHSRSWSEFDWDGRVLAYRGPCSETRRGRMEGLVGTHAIALVTMTATDGPCAIAHESCEFLAGPPHEE